MFRLTRQLTLESPLDLEAVRSRLIDRLVARAGLVDSIFRGADALSDPVAEKPEGIRFVGTVSLEAFELMRWTPYRNSVRPSLQGNLRRNGEGTTVDVRMRMPPFALIAVLAWGLVVGAAVFARISGIDLEFRVETLLPIALTLLVISLFPLIANWEVRKAKVGLATVVEAVNAGDHRSMAP
jgi:hypothetical protein